jgi:hypothetical protein
VSDRHDPRERWRWEEEREREDQGLESEGRFSRHGGDLRWGTGGLCDRRARRGLGDSFPPSAGQSPAGERFLVDEHPSGSRGGPYAPHAYDPRAAYPWPPGPPPGPYTGLGPRGYQRGDERLREDVCDRLTEHGEVDARDMEVVVSGGEVTLSGTAPTRTQKRLAEDIADAVVGVIEVHNSLRVQRPMPAP